MKSKVTTETLRASSLDDLIGRIEAILQIYRNSGYTILSVNLWENNLSAVIFYEYNE